MILGYCLNEWEHYRMKIPVETTLSKNPHVLITGKSGSGKSQSFLWYAYHILNIQESLLYICDFKAGIEYSYLRDNSSYTYADHAISMIHDFYELYSLMRVHSDFNIPHITLVIEEWFGLLTYMETIDKKKKNELMSKIGEVLALGRGIGNGIGIFLMVQRADSSNFSAGSREQFQSIVSFGRQSKEQKQMLFAGEELTSNRNYSAGQGIALIDGQNGAQEIIVPWVPEQHKLMENISHYLNCQPTLQTIIRQIQQTEDAAEQAP